MMKLLIISALTCLMLSSATQRDTQHTDEFRIISLKAFLFFNHTGTFSENIIDNPKTPLWNVVIGGGTSGGPSEATMVLVELAGEPRSYTSSRKLNLIVAESGKQKKKLADNIGVFNSEGKFFVAFWLYGTGCSKINLTAEIEGQKSIFRLTKVIPFECGE